VLTAAAWLEATLDDGRHFIGGDAPGHGDLALYANIWFVKSVPIAGDTAAAILGLPILAEWFARMAAIGHGRFETITADDAIAVARAATPAEPRGTVIGFAPGDRVLVKTDGSGDEPVAGEIVRCDPSGITVLRDSAEAGRVAVHFPRLGQMVLPG
jgi:glutathione S-transferase